MEVSGLVCPPAPCFSSSTTKSRLFHSFSARSVHHQLDGKSVSEQFSDKSHLLCYDMKKEKKEMKKKMKLLKGLSKNLSTFSDMGFGLNPDQGLDHQVKGQMISEASEILLAQLQKLKAEELESKRRKKEEKAKKKAASSESSSSSESECEKEKMVVRNHLKSSSNTQTPSSPSAQVLQLEKEKDNVVVGDGGSCKKIEVCMGGKCKKSGAALLLENFQAAVGGEAAMDVDVVGCKCMGKCRDGPNVRIRSSSNQEEMRNPLCIGVGLEDVNSILTNFFAGTVMESSPLSAA